jgi:RimJ/RimL family protein N-acetyltransferase
MRNPVMVGERVYLRGLEKDDADAVARHDAAETDTFMWRFRVPTSPLEHAHWIADAYQQQPPKGIWFAVCLREDDRFIGTVTVFDIDWVNRTGETGSGLGPQFRGQGYGSEAKHLLLEYCFDRIHLHVLKSHVNEPNTRSAAALAKQGYRPAGRQKWDDLKNGRYFDGLLFDVTRPDWLAARDAWRAARAAQPAGG